jgi:hypothetical protein
MLISVQCPDGAYCGGGDCICPIDTSLCPNGCVDTSSDPENCGECDNLCAEGNTCCGGTCVNLASDNANCGVCGHGCLGTSMYCLDSNCTCQSPYGNCGGVCTDLTTWENCGICGNTVSLPPSQGRTSWPELGFESCCWLVIEISAMSKLVSLAMMARVVRAVRILNYKRCYVMASAYRLTITLHIVDPADTSAQSSIIV